MTRPDPAVSLDLDGPSQDLPVARPAHPVLATPPPSPTAEDDGDPEEISTPSLPPRAVKGWAISLALHAALLVVLGLWVFSTERPRVETIDTTLGAEALGDPLGVEGGVTILMGGLAPPPEIPAAPLADATAVVPPTLANARLDSLPDLLSRVSVGDTSAKAPDRPGKGGGAGGDGFGLAKFGSPDGTATERIRGVVVKVGDPQFTLLWDTQADLDLHVTEPGGNEIYWVERGKPTEAGGEIDVDNLTGFGPENISWFLRDDEGGAKAKLTHGPPGKYRWFVRYYGGMKVAGQDVPTHWKVRVKHNGTVKVYNGTLHRRETSEVYTLDVGEAPNPSPPAASATPDRPGPSS